MSLDPRVRWLSPDRAIGAAIRQDHPGAGHTLGVAGPWRHVTDTDVAALGADQVWSSLGLRGSGIRVAVLDTGVDPTSSDWSSLGSSRSRLVAWKDLVHGLPYPYDDNGHGSHVAGIIRPPPSALPSAPSRSRLRFPPDFEKALPLDASRQFP
jgi:subtilisin family serine protease